MPGFESTTLRLYARSARTRLAALLGKIALAFIVLLGAASAVRADDTLTVLLDWFVNPDHASLLTAQYIGAYKAEGLDVTFVAPADPTLPPRQIAAGQGDIGLCYQATLSLTAAQGLPVIRIGTLIDMPLNSLVALSTSGITTMADFKGKKIGFSIAGVDDAVVATMLEHAGLKPSDVTMVNVNFALVTALMSHQVDGVIGAYRNFEVNELKEKGLTPVVFYPEDYGLPMSDELLMIANKKSVNDPRLVRFLRAVQRGSIYLLDHPDEMWDRFIQEHPDLNNSLNKTAWFQTLPRFAKNPFLLDDHRYKTYETFMATKKLVDKDLPLSDYAVQLAE